MIISNSFVRTYLFGSKVARIHNKSFECCVSTAKGGWFQKQSTIIFEPKIDNSVGAWCPRFALLLGFYETAGRVKHFLAIVDTTFKTSPFLVGCWSQSICELGKGVAECLPAGEAEAG